MCSLFTHSGLRIVDYINDDRIALKLLLKNKFHTRVTKKLLYSTIKCLTNNHKSIYILRSFINNIVLISIQKTNIMLLKFKIYNIFFLDSQIFPLLLETDN